MDAITITFGAKNYALTIAVTDENRDTLLQQFRAAVTQLTTPKPKKPKDYLPGQQTFSFCK